METLRQDTNVTLSHLLQAHLVHVAQVWFTGIESTFDPIEARIGVSREGKIRVECRGNGTILDVTSVGSANHLRAIVVAVRDVRGRPRVAGAGTVKPLTNLEPFVAVDCRRRDRTQCP